MKIFNIGGKDYKVIFDFEASLYGECTEKVTGLLLGMAEGASLDNLKQVITGMADIPQSTLIMFHAGLLENNPTGDIEKTKALLKQYFSEHKGEETGNFFGFMQLLIECMGEDGFFKQIGLEQMTSQVANKEETGITKIPQDHKPKTTRTRTPGVKS